MSPNICISSCMNVYVCVCVCVCVCVSVCVFLHRLTCGDRRTINTIGYLYFVRLVGYKFALVGNIEQHERKMNTERGVMMDSKPIRSNGEGRYCNGIISNREVSNKKTFTQWRQFLLTLLSATPRVANGTIIPTVIKCISLPKIFLICERNTFQ